MAALFKDISCVVDSEHLKLKIFLNMLVMSSMSSSLYHIDMFYLFFYCKISLDLEVISETLYIHFKYNLKILCTPTLLLL